METFSKKEAILFAWDKFKENSIFLLILFIVSGLISVFFDFMSEKGTVSFIMAVSIIGFIVQIVIEMGLTKVVLDIYDSKKINVETMFKPIDMFLPYLASVVISIVLVSVGLLFFIIPGFIIGVAVMYAPYLVIDKKLGPIESIKKSLEITKGHRVNLFFFNLILLFLNLAGLILFGLALLVTIPVSYIAMVHVYRFLLKETDK